MSDTNAYNLTHGREIIIPVTCSCSDPFSQAIFVYNACHSESLFSVACGVFEGLVKAQILKNANPHFNGDKLNGSLIEVPVRCACPEVSDKSNGTNYLVTYPIVELDNTELIARKFGVSEGKIRDANSLEPFASIIPQTTLLIPLKTAPVLNLDVATPYEDAFSPRTAISLRKIVPGANYKNLYVILGGGVFAATVILILACGGLVFIRRRYHQWSFQPLSARSSQLTDFPHDFLDGMSKLKHSLINFTLEELMIATNDFCEASVIGKAVYRGKIGDSDLAIEQMNSMEAAHHVIDILTMINHLNVVKLVGFCSETRPCLVYEFAENGSLRDCLSNSKKAMQLTWARRIQIAFDLLEGLHYIHYSTKPAYVHRNINSRNVLVTIDWRAKISGFRLAKPIICSEEKCETSWNESVIVGRKDYLAPEYLTYGQASVKVDIYAFGIVLIELLSAKEAITDGKFSKDSISFLADEVLEESSGCLQRLKRFMDPNLEGDYPLGDAMCLAILAKACVEEDPLHRPTMNDVLRALSRIL
ncbi:protein LYK5-like [Cornus florida]|uniref:protein LYK5-like n=1 Tax=Cornus florida TaxID=4283 RepID=UPI00289BA270|nr:protein LYK5-like [Cornus florida]